METYLDNLIPQVHYEVAAAIDYNFDLSNETEFGAFLALAQHHGFSTPLLDWTLSPYIAAYFAYREVQETGHSSERDGPASLNSPLGGFSARNWHDMPDREERKDEQTTAQESLTWV